MSKKHYTISMNKLKVRRYINMNNKALQKTLDNLKNNYSNYRDINNFNRVILELGKYMTDMEMDQCLQFLDTIQDSKWDINLSVEDAKTQLELMFGRDRVKEMILKWSDDNQKLLSIFGRLRYRHKVDKIYYDGLDPEDDPNDYDKVYL